MRIIVEGPDGSGKSTLCSELSRRLDMAVSHSGGPIKNEEELHKRIANQLSKNNYIIDRCSVFSEPVYGLTLRGYSLLSRKDFEIYVKKMVIDGWIVIYCKAKGPINKGKEWKNEEHMQGIINNRDQIYNGYSVVMNNAKRIGLYIHEWTWTNYKIKDFPIIYNWMEWVIK